MKTYSGSIGLRTDSRRQIANITDKLNELITKSGIRNGILTGLVKHSTAFLTISGREENLKSVLNILDDIVTEEKLRKVSERNGMDSSIIGSYLQNLISGVNLSVPLINGNLELGKWQSVYFVELAGPRERNISVIIIGE